MRIEGTVLLLGDWGEGVGVRRQLERMEPALLLGDWVEESGARRGMVREKSALLLGD